MMVFDHIRKRFYYYQLHCPLERVQSEINKRTALIGKAALVRQQFKEFPEFKDLFDSPNLVLFRQIATPLKETLQVIRDAKKIGFGIKIIEYHDDIFVSTGNEYKRGLGKLRIFDFTDRNKQDIFHARTIIDFNKFVGKKLCDVRTLKDESLIDFHHELLTFVCGPEANNMLIDGTKWFNQFKGSNEYYPKFFELFLCHNALAETFWGSKDTRDFVKNTIYPSYKRTRHKWSLYPLIYNFQPLDEQDRIFWDCYPKQVDDFLKHKGYI